MHTHTLHVCCVAACCTGTTAPAAVFTYTFVTVYTRRGGVLLCHTWDHVCVRARVCVRVRVRVGDSTQTVTLVDWTGKGSAPRTCKLPSRC